jgi:hypothetical protein
MTKSMTQAVLYTITIRTATTYNTTPNARSKFIYFFYFTSMLDSGWKPHKGLVSMIDSISKT